MTERYFVALLVALPFVGAAGLWLYAFSLCGRTGRMVLTAGLYLVFEARVGRHEMPVYDDEPVRIREHRTEDERVAEYAAMRAETAVLPLTVSSAPYAEWAAQLHPDDLDELRISLERIERAAVSAFSAAVDDAVAEFLRERTDSHALVTA